MQPFDQAIAAAQPQDLSFLIKAGPRRLPFGVGGCGCKRKRQAPKMLDGILMVDRRKQGLDPTIVSDPSQTRHYYIELYIKRRIYKYSFLGDRSDKLTFAPSCLHHGDTHNAHESSVSISTAFERSTKDADTQSAQLCSQKDQDRVQGQQALDQPRRY
jgi:hypothetical protein